MSKDRTEYFRNYARDNREKRAAIKKAWRLRNKEKIAAARAHRAAHPKDGSQPRKPSAPRVAKPKTDVAKAEAHADQRERFAAFRAAKRAAA